MRFLDRELGDDRSDVLTLRYEDIVEDTAGALQRMNAFLGLNIDPSQLNQSKFGVIAASNSSFGDAAPGISSKPIGRWREKMPPKLVGQMNFILRDLLDKYDYEVPDTETPRLHTRLKLYAILFAYGVAKQLRQLLFPFVRR